MNIYSDAVKNNGFGMPRHSISFTVLDNQNDLTRGTRHVYKEAMDWYRESRIRNRQPFHL